VTTSVTVLGCSGTHAGPGVACSSYLITAKGYRLLLDCGNGSLANLQRHIDVADVDAIVISHIHPDHFVDIYGFYYALRFHPDGPLSVPVYAPAGAGDFAAQLLQSGETFHEVCRFQAAAAGDRLELGPLHVELFAASHPVETLASRVDTGDEVVAYSADSGPTDALVHCAREADLFMCDASWLERDGPFPEGVHMTGAEAGRTAAAAAARRLLVTHVYPGFDPREVAAEAAEAYTGQVLIAKDHQEYLL
jgi:ribonuclease BN (tRNA processing enzyme)